MTRSTRLRRRPSNGSSISSPSDVFDLEVTAALRQDIAEDIRVQRLRIARCELLQAGHAKTLDLPALEDFPDMFIFARLVLGLSEEQFADQLGIAAQFVSYVTLYIYCMSYSGSVMTPIIGHRAW